MIDIRQPNITGNTPAEQLSQIRSYLYQFAGQLQWALNNIDVQMAGDTSSTSAAGGKTEDKNLPSNTFNSIKSLIIKSADIVDAYYQEINRRLDGVYVAQSDFGTYSETTSQEITANSRFIEQLFTDLQVISDTLDGMQDETIRTSAYMKSGLLYYADNGAAVYGLEVGQTNTVDGEEVFDKFARFTSDRLSFYDKNDVEVAYISDYKLFITNAEIIGNLTVGGYLMDTSNGLAFKWVGRR